MKIFEGDALDLLGAFPHVPVDLVVTDPPYAFGGTGPESALSATVAVVLREAAKRLREGAWMLVFSASSWRAVAFMAESVRGVVDPVRVGTWCKPESRTKVAANGWRWASVAVLAFRKGRHRAQEAPPAFLDHVEAPTVTRGRRAQLPDAVCDWAVAPFAVPGGVFLDPFAGSGALVAAAERAGMTGYGFEKFLPARPTEAAGLRREAEASCALDGQTCYDPEAEAGALPS